MKDRGSGRSHASTQLTPLDWSRLMSALNAQSLTAEESVYLQECKALFTLYRTSLDRFPKDSELRETMLVALAQKYRIPVPTQAAL